MSCISELYEREEKEAHYFSEKAAFGQIRNYQLASTTKLP